MSNISVNSAAGLTKALATAHGGDTILLAAGSYSQVALTNLHFAQDVTIQSADPSAHAVLTSLKVTSSSGLIFKNLDANIAPGTDGGYAMAVTKSDDIHFDGMNIHGTLNNNTSDDRSGLTITYSTNVSVSNSEFHELDNALNIGGTTGAQVTGNSFHDIRIDGFEGTGTSNIVISGNTFTNFHHLAGDHSDAIQFWTAGRTESAHDITITNNVITEGSGIGMQGIFLKDEVGTLPYLNVNIANNVILGGNWSSISIDHGQNVSVTGNDVAAQVRAAGSGLATQARIDIGGSNNVTIANNQSSVIFSSTDTNLHMSGNTTSATLQDTSFTSVQSFFAKNAASLTSLPTQSLAVLKAATTGMSIKLSAAAPVQDAADIAADPTHAVTTADTFQFAATDSHAADVSSVTDLGLGATDHAVIDMAPIADMGLAHTDFSHLASGWLFAA